MAGGDGEKIIYSMVGVTKTVNRKEILKDVSLSYFHGAKIGVLGLNGSGKSNILDSICFVLGISNLTHVRPNDRRSRRSRRFSFRSRSRRVDFSARWTPGTRER